MILRTTSGWQTITADLALILFLITAQAAVEPSERPAPVASEKRAAAESTSALAVHNPARGENIADWLRDTVTDRRQVATISIEYRPGARAAALAEGDRLLEEAEGAGVEARLMVAKGAADQTVVAVDYLRSGEDGTDLAK